jgi:exosortase A-associated hydrolase 1
MHEERVLTFACAGERLYGILSLPTQAAERGVLIVVGGPQYRAGSHRQFTLLARSLADSGIPAMRFDYRGMGDSEGGMRDFLGVEADLKAAVDEFFARVPALREVVLLGLCDGASAAALYACADPRVRGLALLNPWVHTEAGAAKATLKHYYAGRVASPGLWKKIAQGRFDYAAAAGSALRLLRAACASRPAGAGSLPAHLYAQLRRFDGKVLVVLSGADLTAQEFADLGGASVQWRQLLASPHVTRHELAGADHTFSRRAWHDTVAAWTRDWIRAW